MSGFLNKIESNEVSNKARTLRIAPDTRLKLSLSVPIITDAIPVTMDEKGVNIAIVVGETYFIALVLIIQQNADEITVKIIINIINSGLKEKTICSIGLYVPSADNVFVKLSTRDKTKETITLTADCVAKRSVVFSFFPYTLIPAILKPYSNPEAAHNISPIPQAPSLKDTPFSINALTRLVSHRRVELFTPYTC